MLRQSAEEALNLSAREGRSCVPVGGDVDGNLPARRAVICCDSDRRPAPVIGVGSRPSSFELGGRCLSGHCLRRDRPQEAHSREESASHFLFSSAPRACPPTSPLGDPRVCRPWKTPPDAADPFEGLHATFPTIPDDSRPLGVGFHAAPVPRVGGDGRRGGAARERGLSLAAHGSPAGRLGL